MEKLLQKAGRRKVKNVLGGESHQAILRLLYPIIVRDHASDEDGSDSEVSGASESDPESDTEHGIPLKDLRGVGRTIARCCDMFCNINKAIHLVMLSKQEEQAAKGESDSDED